MPPRRGHRRPGGPLGARALPPESRAGAGRAGGGAAARVAGASGGRGGSRDEPPARVLVDGRNVQHALARASGAANLPTAALVARLRAAFAPPTEVELILDGHPGGSPQGRVAPGLHVLFTRSATADAVIAERAADALRWHGAAGAWSVVVVTDDREVRDHARRQGVRVEGTAWLGDRLALGAASPPGLGIGRRPTGAPRGTKG